MMGAKTRLFCLLGSPVGHSLSPAMHNAGFGATRGIDAVYLAFEPRDLQKAVSGMRELGVSGFNVTMPFKGKIMGYLDRVDAVAGEIGAVNTVVNRGGRLVGYNTDGIGAVAALRKVTVLKAKKVLLIGAGGAGRAIGHFLKMEKAEITVADRNDERAVALARSLNAKHANPKHIRSLDFFDVVINASPAGMKPKTSGTPLPVKLLRKGLVVFDIVYSPLETRFLREAKARGCRTISGIEMLLEQGYASFRLFTGKRAPESDMRNAVMSALGER